MKNNKLVTIILYTICGIACALPFIFNDLWFLAWISFVPVLINEFTKEIDKERPYRKAWLRGLSFFYPFGITTFYWILELYPMDFVGFSPLTAFFVVAIAILGVPLFQGLFTSFNVVFLCFMKRNRVKPWIYPIAAASMWIFQEWLQTLTWAGIPWGKLAMGQIGVLQNIQSASLLGSYLVSFIIITFSGYLALFLIHIKNKDYRKQALVFLCSAIMLFVSNYIYGTVSLTQETEYKNEFTAAAIQGNIETNEKWNEDPLDAINTHKELLHEAANDGAQLVVFAETALPFDIDNEFVHEYITAMAHESNVDFLLGCFTHNGKYAYNSTVLVTNENGITDNVYRKQKLVPFGEFLPMESVIKTLLPFLADINQFESAITPGTESSVMSTEYGQIGSLICFDSIYEIVALNSVRNGAEILTISTNDSWFHDSAAVRQHNANAILRAVELDRYVIRAGNTGVSSIITNKGIVTQRLDALVEGYVIDTVKTKDSRTLYSHVGNIIVLFAFVFILISAVTMRVRTKRIEERENRVKRTEMSNRQRENKSHKIKKKKR